MSSLNSEGSGRATPDGGKPASLAGGLAEALKRRQQSMQGKKEDEDEW
jgi:myosin-1